MLYPEGKEAFDRTHIVPIGFHGTESDNRLLVGWNSNQNRVQINKFEKKVRKFNDRKRSYGLQIFVNSRMEQQSGKR